MKPPVGKSLVALGGLVFFIGICTAIETLAIRLRPWAWGSYWYAASFRWMTAGPMIFAGTVLLYCGVEHLRAGPMSNRRILLNSAAQLLLVIGGLCAAEILVLMFDTSYGPAFWSTTGPLWFVSGLCLALAVLIRVLAKVA